MLGNQSGGGTKCRLFSQANFLVVTNISLKPPRPERNSADLKLPCRFSKLNHSALLQDWGYNTVYSFLNTTITCVVITILFTKCMYKYLAMISSLTKQLYFCDIASALVELSNTYTLYKCCGKQLSLSVLVFT